MDPWTGIEASRFGLYVHFPYCLAKCPYCDFAVTVAREIPQARYTRALLGELALRLLQTPGLRSRTLESVFLGGGTPSLWDPQHVGELLAAVRSILVVSADAEVTLEANPEAVDRARLEGFRDAGVNRLSLGVQSFDASTLKALGRNHTGEDVERAFAAARQAKFQNISLDFIYAVPGQTLQSAVADAERAGALGVEHVSSYALTVDRPSLAEETPFARQVRRGELVLPTDDVAVQMADGIGEAYASHGLLRYEISNHARPGSHSRHNALYWTGGDHLALGCGAVGMLKDGVTALRSTNHRSTERYLLSVEAGALPEAGREILGQEELFTERLAMGLRLTSGVALREVATAYGQALPRRLQEAERLVAGGFATWQGERLALTRRGAHLHSEVAARLL